MKHVMAERTGNSTDNFIEWVKECTVTTSQSKSGDSININGKKVTLTLPIINSKGNDYYPLRQCLEEVGETVECIPGTEIIKSTLGENKVTKTLDYSLKN